MIDLSDPDPAEIDAVFDECLDLRAMLPPLSKICGRNGHERRLLGGEHPVLSLFPPR
ncbi:hypothetical protein [Paracoccus sp. TOH]|uniref:hypothetical protein n=1 Tax=Paracoccus sp. TOH TaxID=1263728 RepID=UPI0025AF35B6|nr:hypothetical protein [Paracoccus sp. TOH]WJS86488.1 hypothetical protein NBE95_18635 [Paracoccus sp. TOH]